MKMTELAPVELDTSALTDKALDGNSVAIDPITPVALIDVIRTVRQHQELLEDFNKSAGIVASSDATPRRVQNLLNVGTVYRFAGKDNALGAHSVLSSADDGIVVNAINPGSSQRNLRVELIGLVGVRKIESGKVFEGIALTGRRSLVNVLVTPSGETTLFTGKKSR